MRDNTMEERKIQYIAVNEDIVCLTELSLSTDEHDQFDRYGKKKPEECYWLRGKIQIKDHEAMKKNWIVLFNDKYTAHIEIKKDDFEFQLFVPRKRRPNILSLELLRPAFPNGTGCQFDQRLGVVFIDG